MALFRRNVGCYTLNYKQNMTEVDIEFRFGK